MNILNSKIYQVVEFIINLLIINLLWIILCLPIVTIGPATASLFAAVRNSVIYKETQIFKPFFKNFILYFKKSFLIGIIIPILISTMIINFIYILNLKLLVILPFLILLIFLVISALTFLFPIIVSFNTNWLNTIKNSLLFSISYLPTTLLNLCIIIFCVYCILMYPVTIFFIFGLSAYCIFLLCNLTFKKTKERQYNTRNISWTDPR